MGWLADRALDARIAMTAKELRWDLESSSPLRRAIILALAQHFRVALVGAIVPPEALSEPAIFGRQAIGQYYWHIETMRNAAQQQLEQLQRSLPRLGIAMPQFAIDHANNSRRGLEVWMVTLGCAVNLKAHSDVIASWNMMLEAAPEVVSALDEIVKSEALTLSVTGSSAPGEFSGLDRADWLRACTYLPEHLL